MSRHSGRLRSRPQESQKPLRDFGNGGAMHFTLRSTVSPPDLRIELSGELDIFTAGQVGREVDRALWAGCRRAELDTSNVTFIDASALGVLVRARNLMRSCAGSMEIVSFSPVVLRLCVLTGLVSLLANPSEVLADR